jgi:hypothetical protein
VITARVGNAKIGEEGNSLGLGEKRVKLSPIIRTKIERSESPEFYH